MKLLNAVTAMTMALTFGVHAFWRMECQGRVGLARIDPLISPGTVAQHAHAIHGSSGFGMAATYDDLRGGSCTSCRVKQDMSVYWHPALYFQDEASGKFEIVPQVGGMLAYYLLFGQNIKAFPPGFQMIAGDSRRRSYKVGDPSQPDPGKSDWAKLGQTGQADLKERALGFNCLNYKQAGEATLYRHFLPDKSYLDEYCANGLRFELMFPSCWNGKDLDSDNHQDHMAYPNLVIDGQCPEDFPIRLPSLLYETIWDTYAFKDRAGRFVIANGDTLGFGYHADFMTGWDEAFLQQAIDICTNDSGLIGDCPIFDIQDEYTVRQCEMDLPEQLISENVTFPGASLPGNVAITYGDGTVEEVGEKPKETPPAAPTLTYQPAAPSTASLPGDVFKEAGGYDPLVPPPRTLSTSTPSEAPIAIQAVASVTTEAPPPPPPTTTTPEPTTAPEPTPILETKSFYSTQTVTVGNIVSLIFWEEETVFVTQYEDVTTTVTMTATAAAKHKAKRQILHNHGHRHHN